MSKNKKLKEEEQKILRYHQVKYSKKLLKLLKEGYTLSIVAVSKKGASYIIDEFVECHNVDEWLSEVVDINKVIQIIKEDYL